MSKMMKQVGSWMSSHLLFLLILLAVVPSILKVVHYSLVEDYAGWWPTYNYLVGYETGFGGRKLIGTLFGWIMPDYIEPCHIRMFILPANLLMLMLFAWFVYRASSLMANKRFPLLLFVAVYAVSPFSIMGFVDTKQSLGFMDAYQLVLTMVWLLLYMRRREGAFYYVATLLIVVVCLLIHHTFLCTLFPLFISLFVYDIMSDNGNWRRKLLYYASVSGVIALLFFAMWRFSRMNVEFDVLYDRLCHKADTAVLPDKSGLWFLYYMSNGENVHSNHDLLPLRYVEFLYTVVLLFPLYMVLYYPWMSAARKAESMCARLRYRAVYLSVTLLSLPIFIVATDYTRWWLGFCFSMFAVTMVAVHIGDEGIIQRLKAMFSFARRRWWLAIVAIIYLAQFSALDFRGLKQAIELRMWLGPQ